MRQKPRKVSDKKVVNTLLWAHAMVPVEMIVVMILSTPLRMARAHLSTSLCRARPAKREREGERNIHF